MSGDPGPTESGKMGMCFFLRNNILLYMCMYIYNTQARQNAFNQLKLGVHELDFFNQLKATAFCIFNHTHTYSDQQACRLSQQERLKAWIPWNHEQGDR